MPHIVQCHNGRGASCRSWNQIYHTRPSTTKIALFGIWHIHNSLGARHVVNSSDATFSLKKGKETKETNFKLDRHNKVFSSPLFCWLTMDNTEILLDHFDDRCKTVCGTRCVCDQFHFLGHFLVVAAQDNVEGAFFLDWSRNHDLLETCNERHHACILVTPAFVDERCFWTSPRLHAAWIAIAEVCFSKPYRRVRLPRHHAWQKSAMYLTC